MSTTTPLRRFWCQQGSLYTLVEAHNEADARALAERAFRLPQRRPDVTVREATPEDIDTWERLGQLKKWLDAGGAEVLADG